jgi:hypothetical protein
MTASEEAATLGRYQETTEHDTAPFIDDPLLKPGRIAAAPRGSVFVRDPAEERAKAIRTAVERFESSGAQVPEHLAHLAAGLEAAKEPPKPTPAKEAAQAAQPKRSRVSTPDAATVEAPEERAPSKRR